VLREGRGSACGNAGPPPPDQSVRCRTWEMLGAAAGTV
jgi:hypothetical protein